MARQTRLAKLVKMRGAKRRAQRAQKKAIVPRNVVSTGVGFPKRLVMTHKYTETVQVNNTTGLFNTYFISANGLFDPNITGGGHQPMFFDQLTALYNHYVVIGSKCTFKFTPAAVTSQALRVACFIEDAASTSATSVDGVSEQSLAGKTFLLPAGNNTVGTRTLKFSPKKTFGKSVLANSNLRGNSGGNPSEQSYFVFSSQGDGLASTIMILTVEVTYITCWFELKDNAGS